MKNVAKVLGILVLLGIFYLVCYYFEPITEFIDRNIINRKKITIYEKNVYESKNNLQFVNETDDFYANNKQELLNIFYTVLNNGWTKFSFYCEYDNCNKDINDALDTELLSNINNFVHPYNGYVTINFAIDDYDKITLYITHSYSNEEIVYINNSIDSIINSIITDDMDTKTKIETFHDYVIMNTIYDNNYVDKGINDNKNISHKATGILKNGKALCGGYTDIMAIFLSKIGVFNYRIASDTHTWNLVYYNNNWYHLDVTWDDTNNKAIKDFFMITTDKLESYNTTYHVYSKDIYMEAK